MEDKVQAAKSALEDAAMDAAQVLVDMVRAKSAGRNAQSKLAAAREILNRAGVPAVAESRVTGTAGGPVRVIVEYVPSPAKR